MNITISKSGRNGSRNSFDIQMTVSEEKALEKARKIAVGRLRDAAINFDASALEWSLLGALRAGGISGLMQYAETAKVGYRRQPTMRRGYC